MQHISLSRLFSHTVVTDSSRASTMKHIVGIQPTKIDLLQADSLEIDWPCPKKDSRKIATELIFLRSLVLQVLFYLISYLSFIRYILEYFRISDFLYFFLVSYSILFFVVLVSWLNMQIKIYALWFSLYISLLFSSTHCLHHLFTFAVFWHL